MLIVHNILLSWGGNITVSAEFRHSFKTEWLALEGNDEFKGWAVIMSVRLTHTHTKTYPLSVSFTTTMAQAKALTTRVSANSIKNSSGGDGESATTCAFTCWHWLPSLLFSTISNAHADCRSSVASLIVVYRSRSRRRRRCRCRRITTRSFVGCLT